MKTVGSVKAAVYGPIVHEIHMRLSEPPRADGYVRIDSALHSLGGSGAFAALALAANGIEVTVFAPKHNDEYGAWAQAALASRGIRWRATCQTDRTPVFYSMYDPLGPRWVVHDRCLFQSNRVPDHVDCDFVMLYPTVPEDALEVAETAYNDQLQLIFCPNASLLPYPDAFTRSAEKASWLIVNDTEARGYTCCSNTKDALIALGKLCSNVIVTQGSDGAILCTGGTQLSVSTIPVHSCIEAGAGDVAAAVFCAGIVAHGLSASRSLEIAQAVVTRYLARGDVALENPLVFGLLSMEVHK